MKTARNAHTATRLPDGRVLVVGGETYDRDMLSSTEIFDPASETWSAGPPLSEPRSNHAAVSLADGRVLILGGGKNAPIGQPLGEGVLASALIFDPESGALMAAGSMRHARSHFQAVRLASGHVLVAGGGSDVPESPAKCGGASYCGPFGSALASAELFDPATGEWTEVDPMTEGRFSFSLTVLPSGRVVAVGGVNAQGKGFATTEVFDPETRTWAAGPSLQSPREHHTAEVLGTGRLIVAGGKNPNVTPLDTTELLDVEATKWTKGQRLPTPRTSPSVLVLESGRALFVGGYDQLASIDGNPGCLADARIWDDEARAWTDIAPLSSGRLRHSVTLLADGRVLVAGGMNDARALATSEIGEPAP